ncbi:hypothetical protein DPMN_148422 [Dreissena polymorpha]|uniref:Uncharacterized protein n=1 Tax=Dreissena polymorpha TaxID=45954 RepID=A0A9D4J3V4_DREPO|nr:hypothetical protein DPMN_148422 [Dreissena polymorpha]
MTLATKAFRDLPEDYMYSQVIQRFCHGCINKEAGEVAANARPSTMEAAVDKVKWAVHTHTAVHGRAKRDVRQTTVHESSQGWSVYEVKEEPQSQTGQSTLTRLGACEKRMDTIEKQISKIKNSIDTILERLPYRQSRSASPSPNRTEHVSKGTMNIQMLKQPMEEEIASVTVCRTTVITPSTFTNVECVLNKDFTAFVVEQFGVGNVAIPRALYNHDQKPKMCVMNMTVEPVENSVPKAAPLRSGYKTWDPGTKGFGAAVGIHSKKLQFEELRSLLRLKDVVALGEIDVRPHPRGSYKRRY